MIRGAALRNSFKSISARRFISSANAPTKYTTLSNGVTLATENNPNAETATVGLWIGSGSRSETPYSNGIAALTGSILGSGLKNNVLLKNENTKESSGIVATTTTDNVKEAASLISEIVANAGSILEKADFEKLKAALIARAEKIEADPSKKVLQHLSATAFQGYSLELPALGTAESIPDLELQDSQRYLDKNLLSSNVVVAASGNFDLDKLIDAFSSLNVPQGAKPAAAPAKFLGSEIRMRDDTLPKAYVSIAVEGEGASSPAYYVAKVAAAIFGDFDQNSAAAKFTSPKLASIVQEYHIVDKYTHFSNSYADTGLWGFNAEISNITSIDEFVHFALKQWNRLSISVTDAEVARAKAAVKVALLSQFNSTEAIASDIAHKILLAGHRPSVSEALQKIDAITTKDIKDWAQATLWDKDIVISGTGQIEDLLDYNRCRNEMAMMRW